jgi:hypothetical protein
MKTSFHRILFFTFAVISVYSCRKSDRSEDKETQSSKDNAIAEWCWSDVFKQLDDAASITADVNKLMPHAAACYTVSVNPALPNPIFPKTVTLDFGTTYCTGTDGLQRKGKIIATFSGRYRDSLTVISITTNNYYVNGYEIQGTKTITNNGHINGIATFSVSVQNAYIYTPVNKIIEWSSARTHKWIAGEGTIANVLDDVYEITGTANGRSTNGNKFNITITSPLRVEISCRYIVSGEIKIEPQNLVERFINFGSGACDDKATVTVLGNSYEITLQ